MVAAVRRGESACDIELLTQPEGLVAKHI